MRVLESWPRNQKLCALPTEPARCPIFIGYLCFLVCEFLVQSCLFFFMFFYFLLHFKNNLFMRHREAETWEGEAGSTWGAQRGTWSRVSRISPGLKTVLNHWATWAVLIFYYFLKRFYLFEIEITEGEEREHQRGGRCRLYGEWRAWCGALSQDMGIMTRGKDRCLINWVTQVPLFIPSHWFWMPVFFLFCTNVFSHFVVALEKQSDKCNIEFMNILTYSLLISFKETLFWNPKAVFYFKNVMFSFSFLGLYTLNLGLYIM